MGVSILDQLVDETYDELVASQKNPTKEILYDVFSRYMDKDRRPEDDECSVYDANYFYNLGYDDGLDVGYEDGKINAYTEGYSSGKIEGYDEGYDRGYQAHIEDARAKIPLKEERDISNLQAWSKAFDAAAEYLTERYGKDCILDDCMISPYCLVDFIVLDKDGKVHFVVVNANKEDVRCIFPQYKISQDAGFFFEGWVGDKEDYAVDVMDFYLCEDGRTRLDYTEDAVLRFI